MQNGNVVQDIYSGVIIPLFGFLIFLIAFFSIYGIVKGILNEKREEIAIIRSMGVNARATVVWLFLEFVIIALLGSLLGILLGVGIHELMTGVLNRFENLNIHSAFSASEYVKAVTVSPFLYTLLIVLLAVCLASLPLIYSFIKNTPTELLQNKTAHRKRKREKQSGKRKTWFCVLNRRIRLFDGSICVSAMIIVSVTVLGYLFFCALSELDQSEIDSAMMDMETDTGSYDYMAETTNSERMYTFHIENGHDSGIDKESYVDLKNNHAVEEIHAQIRNMSTRISYRKKALQSAKKNFLEEYSLREHSSFDTDFEQQLSLAEEAMITAIGYDKDDGIYSTPTIGMTEEDIGELEPALSCGNINEAALREGSEVILAVPEEKLEECLNYFQVGENIPMSDIVLSDEEEKYDFSSLLPANVTSPVYKKNVVTDDGDHVELTSYAFGKRKNITAQIGAIVGITEENEKFFPQMSEYMGADYEGYGICIVCGVDAFTNWGLPDRLFTNLSVTLKEDADVDAFDSAWYQQLAQCKGISYLSLKENYDEKQEIEKKNMTVFYMLLVMIAVYGFIAVLIAMYNKHRLKSQEFAYLKSVGLSNGQMLRLILYKNVVYPLAGMVFAPIPVAACQMFFDYIRKNVDSGTWDSLAENINEIPWYHYVPFRYHLYNIHFFTSLLAGTGIVLLIVSVASLSGIRYLIRQNIAEEFEINHF
jgi:ABC-type lipoprotein release transport system permease subunit